MWPTRPPPGGRLRGIVYCCILYTAVYLYTCIPVTVDVYQVYSWEDAGRCDGAVYLVYRLYTCILGCIPDPRCSGAEATPKKAMDALDGQDSYGEATPKLGNMPDALG